MAKANRIFCCPNCFAQCEKGDSILMLTSGAAVAGDGLNWSGQLERDIHKVKRIKYCRRCGRPLDFHALLRGKLDYRAWGPLGGMLAFLLAFAALWFWFEFSFWGSLALAAIASAGAAYAGSWLERRRLARWRIGDSELAGLSGAPR